MLLIGPLAHPELRLRLAPAAVEAPPLAGCALVGGRLAGIAEGAWPAIVPAAGSLPAWETGWTPALRRYAAIFGIEAQVVEGREVLGIGPPALGDGTGNWQPELAGAIADCLLAQPGDRTPEELRRRLPQIATWVASRLRAASETAGLPQVGPEGAPRLRIGAVEEPYARFFSIQEITLRQRLHDGAMSPEMLRAVFVSGDAAVMLPWDPRRDRVLLIDQLRAGPLARGDAQPWLYETVAGRVDAGETPEEAAIREAREEARITVRQLFPGPHHYPTPGIVAEHLYLYVGIADLPDETAGTAGLAEEDEDIRSHLVARAELTRMALAGEIRNGPLLALALWLELRHDEIRRALAGLPPSGGGV